MKTRFTLLNILFPVIIAGLLAACSAASSDTDAKDSVNKTAQLEGLKKQRAELDTQIKQLEAELGTNETAKVKSKDVAVTVLTPTTFEYYVQTQGSVEAVDNIPVSAKMPGVLSAVYAREGQVVSKGQMLAQIDNSVVLSNIEELKSGIELANTVYERQKNLWDQKIGTEVQYLQAKNNKEGLEKRMATLNEQLEMTRIKSPISGSVDEVSVKIGEAVQPGVPAFRVVSVDKLKVNANVSEAYVVDIKEGNKATISFPDINRKADAKVTFVGQTINAMSRTFAVEVSLNAQADLRPNMTGILKVIFKTIPNALSVPVNVVQVINDQEVVYVAEVQGNQTVARKKVVKVEGIYGTSAHVTGLHNGDKVITVGYQGLNDGEVVKF